MWLVLLFACSFLNAFSQEPDSVAIAEEEHPVALQSGIFGRVIDTKTHKGLLAASVQLFISRAGSSPAAVRDSLIAGTLTSARGDFHFNGVLLLDSALLVVSALGHEEVTKTFLLPVIQDSAMRADLGNIQMVAAADMLGVVTVVAKTPTLQMGIDRKIFNVDKSLTSTGGTGLDVMRSIPSVQVDVDGNVTMRNSSPQIFVDGRPTILTLEQIPADDIERIELVTNPSAKFDAATSGGIINVVLKQNRRNGLNGIASFGFGAPKIATGSLSLNLRKNKFNLFGTGSLNSRAGTADGVTYRQNKSQGSITDYFTQSSDLLRTRRFKRLRLGADYFMDNRNTLSLSEGLSDGHSDNLETQYQQYFNANQELSKSGFRNSDGRSQFDRTSTQLNFTHSFARAGRKLTADITYNTGTGTSAALITNDFSQSDGQPLDPSRVRNSGTNSNKQWTLQADFENPVSEHAKWEMGIRSFMQDNTNRYDAFNTASAPEQKLPVSTNVQYSEAVHAAYSTYSGRLGKTDFQLGLRAELSTFKGQLVDSAERFGYQLPTNVGHFFDGLFPSLYLTRALSGEQEVQLNFSRRIHRPGFWQLNPFINLSDPLNISQGNPDLRPEYTNSAEFNYNYKFPTGNFLGVVYFRNNAHDIIRFSDTLTSLQYEQLNNAGIDSNAVFNTFVNAQSTNRMGAEITVNYLMGNFEIIPNINLQYRSVKALYSGVNLSNQGFNWEGKLILNYKPVITHTILKNLSIQLLGNYQSQEITAQGRNKAQFVSDIAVRKQFLKKNAGTITLSANNIFNTDRWGQIYDTENFYQDAYRRNIRSFRMTFSYRFGSSDLNLFGSKSRKMQPMEE
ncbi:MAG: TonB-dependent receptor [Flavitalea sp.]